MLQYDEVKISDLTPNPNNPRVNDEAARKLVTGIEKYGFVNPVIANKDGLVLAGHTRIKAMEIMGKDTVPVLYVEMDEATAKGFSLFDNKSSEYAEWNEELLTMEMQKLYDDGFNLMLTGFDSQEIMDMRLDIDIDAFLAEHGMDGAGNGDTDPYADGEAGSMVENFGQPPFSILDTRKGDWLAKKRYWRELIGDNGESREGTLSDTDSIMGGLNSGVSLLDPVMAELMVSWFGCKDGVAFDPFAGDSIFGYVSAHLGMEFKGIELRAEQALLNQQRVDGAALNAIYYTDTSENMDKYIAPGTVDLMFTCPPYADLEVYSDNPMDLSTMAHDDFFKVYKKILQNTYTRLKDNRFAVVVMGEVRGKDGSYIGTIPKTIDIMEQAGYKFYNEIILVNGAGTLPLRAGKAMRATRKVGKMHQNILVFLKGDARKAVEALGDIEMDFNFNVEEFDASDDV